MANLLGQLLVELGINTAAWKEGLDKATYQAKAFAKDVGDQFSAIGDSVKGLASSFAGLDPALGGAIQGIAGAFENIAGAAGGVAGATTGIVAAFGAAGVAAIGLAVKGSEAAARMGELSKATGIAVPTLSLLADVAGTVGIGADQMAKALEKMDKSAVAAAQSGPKASNAYTTLGIAVTDASGNMREANDIFSDVSTKFANMADGPEKTALAIKIFGRTGADMIPVLDKGGQKLVELEGHFSKLGAVIDDATAQSSEELKSNMSLMGAAFQGIENELVKQLVPALNTFATEFISFFEENHDAIVAWVEAFADAGKIVINIFQGLVGLVKVVEDAFFGLIGVLQGTFDGLGKASYDALHGNFRDAWTDVKQGGTDAANAAKLAWSDAAKDIGGTVKNIGDIWDAQLAAPEKKAQPTEKPAAKQVDTTWIDKLVQASARAEQKQQDLADAIGIATQASIEAAAAADSNEQIQKIWDEAVDKGIEKTKAFAAAFRAAVPEIQANAEWMETFKAAVEDQKGIDKFNETINKQIAALKDAETAHSALALAQAKNTSTLEPLNAKLAELQAQYETLKAQYGETDARVVQLNTDVQRQGNEMETAAGKVKLLNDELQKKAAAQYNDDLAKLAGTQTTGNKLADEAAAKAAELTKKYGDAVVSIDAVTAALIKMQGRQVLDSATSKTDLYGNQLAAVKSAIDQLQKAWDPATMSAEAYGQTLRGLQAQQADLEAKTGGFSSGFKAGLADLAAKTQSTGETIRQTMGQALDGISSNFASMIATGKASWQSLITSMEEAILKSQLQNLLSGLFSGLEGMLPGGGGFGGGFMSAFGGGKERGGDVTPGKWYVVGEKRPEVFVPHTTGTILPSAASGAMQGGDTHVQMYVQTSDANSFSKSAGQMVRDMTRSVGMANARNRGAI